MVIFLRMWGAFEKYLAWHHNYNALTKLSKYIFLETGLQPLQDAFYIV